VLWKRYYSLSYRE